MMSIAWGRSVDWKMSFNGFEKFSPSTFKPMEITERIYNGCDCYDWRVVFAFWPVKTVSGKYVWFRKIYKRKFWVVWGAGFHMEPVVEYGNLFDIIKNEH